MAAPLSCYVQSGRLCCATFDGAGRPLRTSVRIGAEYTDGEVQDGVKDQNLLKAIEVAKTRLMTISQAEAQKQAVEALVTRARCGDQNAMAIIYLIGKNASAGQPKAVSAYRYLAGYIQKNPPGQATIGQDRQALRSTRYENQPLYVASLCMANGPPLTPGHVSSMIRTFGAKNGRNTKLLTTGLANFASEDAMTKAKKNLPPADVALVEMGQTIGRARAIQIARTPTGKISILSPYAGWELGERC